MLDKVNLAAKFAAFSEHWSPKIAGEEAEVVLFEPATTLNTGVVRNERTRERLDRI